MAIFKISKSDLFTERSLGFYTSCSDISQKLPPKFSKVAHFTKKLLKSCFLSTQKKSVSTTDDSKSLRIYTNYLLIYIFLPTRLHSYTYRDDILVPPPVYLILHQFMGVCFKYRQFTFNKNHAIYHSMMLTNKTLFENIYKFDDSHIRICVHYDESQALLNLFHVLLLC